MGDPRWTEETAEIVALATGAHHLDPDWADADRNTRCVCGGWAEGPMEPGWDDHMAEVALAALADAGLLVEPGGKTRVERTAEHIGYTGALYHRPIAYDPADDVAALLAWHRLHAGGSGHRILDRTVHTGPWRAADS